MGINQDAYLSGEDNRIPEVDTGIFFDVFADAFVAAYYVSLSDHRRIVFKTTDDLFSKYGRDADYFRVFLSYVENCVYAEDRKKMAETADVGFIRKKMSLSDRYDVMFRDISSGELRFHTMSIMKGRDDDHVAIAFIDSSREISRKDLFERNAEIINTLSEDYSLIFVANLQNDESHTVNMGPLFKRIIATVDRESPMDSTYSKRIDTIGRKIVHPDDREMYYEILNIENIKKQMKLGKTVSFDFRVVSFREIRHFRIKVVPYTEYAPSGCIIGVRDVEDEYEERRIFARDEEMYRRAIIFEAEAYYKVNITKKEMIAPIVEKINGQPTDVTANTSDIFPDVDAINRFFSKKHVDVLDREEYDRKLAPEYLLDCYNSGNMMPSFVCHVYYAEREWHYRKYVSYLSRDEVTGDIYAMNVAYNFDDEVDNKRKSDREIDRIMKLSNNFEAIYDVVVETGEYTEFTRANAYAENISVKFVPNSNYYEDVRINALNVVCIEDREDSIRFNSKEFFRKVVDSGKAFSYDYRLIFKGEPIWYRVRMQKTVAEDGRSHMLIGVFNVDEEVKERASRQAQLEKALDDARSANKAKTVFLNNMSHDIRTPMNAIIGFSRLANEHIDEKTKVEEYLSKISQSSDFLLSLINEVLDMSRIEAGEMNLNEHEENLIDLVNSIQDIITSDVNAKNIEFVVDTNDVRDTNIVCDSLRLNQVLLNIVSNAVKYTPEGGKVYVKITQKPTFKMGYGNYEFCIKDTGIGMSEEFVKRIYDPFTRAKNSTMSGVQGTGLGMAITRKIVEMMDGLIHVDSVEQCGTTVTVSFDFKCVKSASDTKASQIATEKVVNKSDYEGKRILLVEDNELNREIAEEVLAEGGFEVDSVTDGSDAVKVMKTAAADRYDIILMDIQMPIMDGYEATRQIRAIGTDKTKNIPIIAMTANAFEEDKNTALEAGMNEHVTKPIKIDVLYNALDRFL